MEINPPDGSGWAYQVNNCYPDVNSPGYYIRLFEDESFLNALQCRPFRRLIRGK